MAPLRAEEMVLHVALPAPDSVEQVDDLPHTWDAIFAAAVSDVDDGVLPRRTPR